MSALPGCEDWLLDSASYWLALLLVRPETGSILHRLVANQERTCPVASAMKSAFVGFADWIAADCFAVDYVVAYLLHPSLPQAPQTDSSLAFRVDLSRD